ncbi:unnamed protein product [Haemonchus placei]|uniref:Prothymosin alpha-like n=1 Tax=Haemonchus placei TaxID=6290 RepID=A0A0N4WKH9_HAEPC|nr:unnamed protein product [Haemonchus placei]
MDEDNAAADNKTDALAAKEDDTVTADEKLLPPEDELESEQEASNTEDVDNDSTDDEQGKENEECEGEEDNHENDNENVSCSLPFIIAHDSIWFITLCLIHVDFNTTTILL